MCVPYHRQLTDCPLVFLDTNEFLYGLSSAQTGEADSLAISLCISIVAKGHLPFLWDHWNSKLRYIWSMSAFRRVHSYRCTNFGDFCQPESFLFLLFFLVSFWSCLFFLVLAKIYISRNITTKPCWHHDETALLTIKSALRNAVALSARGIFSRCSSQCRRSLVNRQRSS